MSDLYCGHCGAPLNESDSFCRNCGSKIQESSRSESEILREVFCANCGNALRPGARFCDLCGAPYAKPEISPGPVRKPRRGRKKRWRLFKFLILAFLFALIGVSVFSMYRYVLKDVGWRGFASKILTSISGNEPPGEWPAPSADVLPLPGSRDETPVSEDAGEGAPETGYFEDMGAPLSAEAEPSPDVAPREAVRVSPVSSDPIPEATIPAPAVSSADAVPDNDAEYVWSAWDAEGYSSLIAEGRFLSPDETPSMAGVVSGDRVRMRAAPNTSARIMWQFDNGVSLNVLRRYLSGTERYYWFEVGRVGEAGWIYGEFLKVASGENMIPEAELKDTPPPTRRTPPRPAQPGESSGPPPIRTRPADE